MAVALATLPLKSLLAGAGDWWLAAAAVSGLAAGFAGVLCADAACLAALPCVGLVADFFAAATALVLGAVLGVALATAALPAAGLLVAGLLTAFFAGVLLVDAFLGGAFFAVAFFAAVLPAGALAAVTFLVAAGAFFAGARAAGLLALAFDAVFFTVALVAGLAAARTGDLPAVATRPLAAVFDLSAVAAALPGFLPLCALAAVELALVFAISLHPDWPWGPRVIADVFTTGKPASGILVPLHSEPRPGNVNIPARLILWLLGLYKRWLSPLLGPRCRFHPSCSDYARIAVTRFGPWRGSLLAGWRLLRCQPLCTGGEDPVPEHFHFARCRDHQAPDDADSAGPG